MISKQRLLNTFLELVIIDSPSGEETHIANILEAKLQTIGLRSFKDTYGNIIGNIDGVGVPLLLNAHLDTVEPGRKIRPKLKNDKILSDGTTVLGADPKAGIAIILESIQSIIEDQKEHPPLEVAFTREEETTFGGSLNLDYNHLNAKQGIIFDGDGEVSNISISSPSLYNINAEITGKAAHAGVEPEKGISAIEVAAKLITSFKLGRLDYETTCNIGLIQGGSVINAVPEKVNFAGEVRSKNPLKLQKIINNIQKISEEIATVYPNAKIQLNFDKEFEGFVISKNNPLITKAAKVLRDMGLQPKFINSGGASDANIFCTKGIQTIVVGTGGYEPHTNREYLIISQMLESAKFAEKFILEGK